MLNIEPVNVGEHYRGATAQLRHGDSARVRSTTVIRRKRAKNEAQGNSLNISIKTVKREQGDRKENRENEHVA